MDENYLEALQLARVASNRSRDSEFLGFTPSERSVTRSLTATSRGLTLAFNLSTMTLSVCLILHSNKMDVPLAEGLLLDAHPALLLHAHLCEYISSSDDSAENVHRFSAAVECSIKEFASALGATRINRRHRSALCTATLASSVNMPIPKYHPY